MPTKVKFKQFKITHLWAKKDSKQTALDTVALIKRRIYKGVDFNGKAFKEYSTTPIYIKKKGARLKPKGGRTKRLKAIRRKGSKRRSRTMATMYFEGGYKQYKELSRKRIEGGPNQTAEVDLTLSGALVNNIVPTDVQRYQFSVGLSPKVRHYGYAVDAQRGFIGLTTDEVEMITAAVTARLKAKLKK